jgi:hypothetical protein
MRGLQIHRFRRLPSHLTSHNDREAIVTMSDTKASMGGGGLAVWLTGGDLLARWLGGKFDGHEA